MRESEASAQCETILVGSALPALSEVEWASRVLVPVRLGLSASR